MKPPLRTVLKSFLNHFEDYEARKLLSDDQYEYEFQQLKSLTDKLREDPDYSCSCALKDVNRPKNRYKDIVPYDKSRVVLPKCGGVPGSDYINASYVKGASGALAYIATQGPLPNTVLDFWRMVWVCEVQVLVMACNEKEVGKNKCEVYWPVKGEIKQFGNISVELIEDSQVCPDFLVRTLLVKCDSEMRDVYQFHYTSWPDHGVPETVQPILELVRLMREFQASETVPILVHCSAGCGRTGTICAVDFVWACLRHGKLSEDFSLFHIALELRRQRIAMIQTKEQYILAHKVVATLFEQQLNVIDCHIYVNIDEDGEPLMWKELIKNKAAFFRKKSPEKEASVQSCIETDDSKVKNKLTSEEPAQVTEGSRPNSSHTNSVNCTLATDSSSAHKMHSKMSISDSLVNSDRNSESSFSRNSYLSQQSNEDNIPFIDDEEVNIRPNCGRAYLNIPSCDTISKIMNYFDPFVDNVALETDDSSPEVDTRNFPQEADSQNGSSKLDKNPENRESSKTSDQVAVNNYATLPSSSCNKNQSHSALNNRESYPPAVPGYTKLLPDSASDVAVGSSSSAIKSKKPGVVRRPSISKLKALFEKSSISPSKSSESGKRSLFRNNSHSVSRAGSAPPSLNCMDKTSDVERESILRMVTRKFRSASVRTEREICSKPSCDKSQNRKSNAMVNLKEGLNTLSRTVSFNLTKTFRSYSPTKFRGERNSDTSSARISFTSDEGSIRSKLPEHPPKGKSVWYDKSYVARAPARPTEKIPSHSLSDVPKSPLEKQISDKNIHSVLHKPPKLLPFFSSLNRPNGKDASTTWYGESNENLKCEGSVDVKTSEDDGAKCSKSNPKVLPFIQSLAPWKKIGAKSPLVSPESPKKSFFGEDEANSQSCNSTFYTDIGEQQAPVLPEKVVKDVPSCPIPEEIIPLIPESGNANSGEAKNTSNKLSAPLETKDMPKSPETPLSVTPAKGQNEEQAVGTLSQTKEASKTIDAPPAIPKKMLIGKNKLENIKFCNEDEKVPVCDVEKEASGNAKSVSEAKPQAASEGKPQSAPVSPKDVYINVNLKAQKNIEQIENTIRNNPRSAIIDLTSRESYCMEEELDNALKELSVSSEEPKPTTVKSNQKFPGYEVIWPESHSSSQEETGKSDCKGELDAGNAASEKCKTGICYSPPLRRSLNSSLGLAKCHSCSNIDWLEPEANVSLVGNSKEPGSSPTKRLVNEAVVELNTLLDQLTTRTLSEEPDLRLKTKQAPSSNESNVPKMEKENLMVHSVTLLSKSNASDSSVKEEEIIFHFPPPPPLPPPDDIQPSETFNIVRKNGCIVVAESEKSQDKSTEISNDHEQQFACSKKDIDLPQPMPRKSKQGSDLKRSASYTNVSIQPNSRYENVFLEKYQTLSRLQIDSKDQSSDSKSCVIQTKPKIRKPLPGYVNISNLDINNSSNVGKRSVNENSGMSTSLTGTVLGSEQQLLNPSKDATAGSTESDMSRSCPPSAFKVTAPSNFNVSENETLSTYGKVSKLPARKLINPDKTSQDSSFANSENFLGAKRKPAPSRKTERAPLPPNVQITDYYNRHSSVSSQQSKNAAHDPAISKKLPSRKLEKAPILLPQLQKCSSSTSIPKKNIPIPYYINFNPSKPPFADEAKVLPALRENIPNTAIPVTKGIETGAKSTRSHAAGHGLSHSRSDASVFLALKERKTQSLNREQVTLNMKPPVLNKIMQKHSVSSSDSDSSYERIFFDKPAEQSRDTSELVGKDQTVTNPTRSSEKELPVAPPRSRRRNTTEVQYAKVKTKKASPARNSNVKDLQKDRLSIEELPPAIPLKSKDIFEIPEFRNKNMDHSLDKGINSSSK